MLETSFINTAEHALEVVDGVDSPACGPLAPSPDRLALDGLDFLRSALR